VVAGLVPAVHSAVATEEGSRLPELFLCRGDQTEIMLRMLEIVLGRNRISRRLRVTRMLQVFIGDDGRTASYFDIRPVRLVHPSGRFVPLAFALPHPFILLVSHD